MNIPSVEQAIFGYTTGELPKPDELEGTDDWSPEQWRAEFDRTRLLLVHFFAARDQLVVLARTALHFLLNADKPRDGSQQFRPIEQVEVEIAQALLLMGDPKRKIVPTSPRNFVRYWAIMIRHIHGFIHKQPAMGESYDTAHAVQFKAKLHTLYYRNLFTKDDCQHVLQLLLNRLNQCCDKHLEFRLIDVFSSSIRIVDLVEDRMHEMADNIKKLMTSSKRSEVLDAIEYFCSRYPLAEHTWSNRELCFEDLDDLRNAGFQISELAWPWAFTIDRQTLEENFEPPIISALHSLSIPIGGLKDANPEHIYLNNPIWRKPYIFLEDNAIFAPLAHLVFSFPFAIMEGLIGDRPEVKSAYEEARADCLEAEVAKIVSEAMPGAKVYRGVVWTDPETNKDWENDVVALLGNFVFVFEAKSGGIQDAARRGGVLSLRKNFRTLYVEPGLQGWRLQDYINQNRDKSKFRLKKGNVPIDFMLDRPKVVYRYSVCFEHFPNIASARHYLKELDLIGDGTAWAPVFTLGELMMIARYLDTELSFQHYLTRRQSLDELIDFDADEQDILSIYLTNGFYIDPKNVEGYKVIFFEADNLVRKHKTARVNRQESIALGVQLPPLWASIVRELYADSTQRHRFDIINVIFNQFPPALAKIERNIRRFRRNGSLEGGDMMIIKYNLGKRVFVLSCYFAKKIPDPDEWQEAGRGVVAMFADANVIVECASVLILRRSKQQTFDGISFYRYGFGSKPSDAQIEEI